MARWRSTPRIEVAIKISAEDRRRAGHQYRGPIINDSLRINTESRLRAGGLLEINVKDRCRAEDQRVGSMMRWASVYSLGSFIDGALEVTSG